MQIGAGPLKSRLHSLWIYTMNRCKRWAATALAALLPLFALAQGIIRTAPPDVKPAVIAVSATPPDITLNGVPARLSPGSRIRDLNNMLVLSGALAGRSINTVYRKDAAGLVHEVWILTPEEYAKVGGIDVGDPDGFKRFNELLAVIFGMRR